MTINLSLGASTSAILLSLGGSDTGDLDKASEINILFPVFHLTKKLKVPEDAVKTY